MARAKKSPKPKFKYGDRVMDDDGTRRGYVDFIGDYDEFHKGFRYKVQEDGGGSRHWWNEVSMRKEKGKAPTKPSYPPLSDEQREELHAYAREHGENWKAKLATEWMRASAPPVLHALRNSHGWEWLESYRPWTGNPRRSNDAPYVVWQHSTTGRWYVSREGLVSAATSARGYGSPAEAWQSASDMIFTRGEEDVDIVFEGSDEDAAARADNPEHDPDASHHAAIAERLAQGKN